MGNQSTSHHHHHHHHNRHLSNDATFRIDQDVEYFFKLANLTDTKIDLNRLLSYFSNNEIIRLILADNCLDDGSENELDLKETKLIFSKMTQATTTSSVFELYTELLFVSPENFLDHQTVMKIFYCCLKSMLNLIGFDSIEFSSYSKNTFEAIIDSINFSIEDGQKILKKENFKDWIVNEFPELFYGVHNCFIEQLKKKNVKNDTNSENKAEDLSIFLNKTMLWYLICNLPGCYLKHLATENGTLIEKLKNCLLEKRWQKLYESENNGLSLNRFQSCLFNYKAPTIMFIYCQSGTLFCVCSNEEYKESPTAYGDDQTRIYKVWKNFKIYDLNTTKNIYLNTKSRGLTQGLIFGYSQLKPILKIDENLHKIEHEDSKNDFVISVEVWGCGSLKASLDQENLKKWESKQIEKMKTAKIDAEWSSNADKAILELAGIKTEHSERSDF